MTPPPAACGLSSDSACAAPSSSPPPGGSRGRGTPPTRRRISCPCCGPRTRPAVGREITCWMLFGALVRLAFFVAIFFHVPKNSQRHDNKDSSRDFFWPLFLFDVFPHQHVSSSPVEGIPVCCCGAGVLLLLLTKLVLMVVVLCPGGGGGPAPVAPV